MRTYDIKMSNMQIYAWTGGTSPEKYKAISVLEKQLVSIFFRSEINCFRNYWGDFPDKDTRAIFWNRAKHDAHATIINNKGGN